MFSKNSALSPATAPSRTQLVTYREALYQVMHQALSENPRAFIIGQGVADHKGTFGTTLGLQEKFGALRVMDSPLAEEAMTGIALGAALGGMYPIQTHIRLDFVLLAANQIINLVAKYKYMFGGRFEIPMLIRLVIGRSWGQGAQHSQSLQSLFAHIPGLTVIMPSDSQSILQAYPYIINQYKAPVLSLEHRLLYEIKFRADSSRDTQTQPAAAAAGNPLSSRLMRKGKDITIVATSIMVLEAIRAAAFLHDKHKIDCEIIDLNCVSHPDTNLILESVKKTGRLVIADTSWKPYGVCAEICRIICETSPALLKSPVVTLGMQPSSCPTAKTLEDMFYPNLRDLCS
ncbi:MAG: alpha-ketoacid dehydrogenase subunit beta, partial [Candidatus Omnitrophica bacterium]|nr:alpha-ketoacid dehydrogenase subunit beta [Candidatus Omnitrophota bacterium]